MITRLFFMSIRRLMFMVVLITVLPMAGIIVYAGICFRNDAIGKARLQTQILADNIATQQQNLASATQQLMSALAQLPDVKKRVPARVNPILADIVRINSRYLNISIADTEGRAWASAILVSRPLSVADRRNFRNALATGRFSSGEYVISRVTSKPAFNFSYPVRDDRGRINGVITAVVDLGFYRQLLRNSKLPQGASFALIDHRGVVLSRGIDPGPYVGKQDSRSRFEPMVRGAEQATFIGPGLDGRKRFTTYRKIRLEGEAMPYMYVRAGIPVEVALREADTAFFNTMAAFAFSLLVAASFAWFVGKRAVVDRVALLEAASRQVAAGDLEVKVSALVEGGELGALGETFDYMAEELKKQQEGLQARALLLENMAEAVSECDREGKILFTNSAFDAMFGYASGDLLGKHALSLTRKSKGDIDALFHDLLGALQREGTWVGEFADYRKDGTVLYTCARISEIRGNGHLIIVQEDISRYKEMDRLKDEMISAVSHEMRTPLTAMLGYVQFMLENRVSKTLQREYLETVYKETERLNDLICNFLDVQRCRSKQEVYNLVPLQLQPILEHKATFFNTGSKNHHVILDCPDKLPLVLGDEEALHRVLNNLLSNAIKYSPAGGDIVIAAAAAEGYVTVSVADTGIGIPAENMERIFERFYRVDNAASRATGGTGIGLAVVEEIVTAHGGRVWAESTVGKGSTFSFSVQAAPAVLS